MAKPLSILTARALTLLKAGVAGGHIAAIVVTGVVWATRGAYAGLTAAVAAVVTLTFYTIGQAVQVAVANSSPVLILLASIASYGIRVGSLGVALNWALTNPDVVGELDPVAVVGATLAVVVGWLAVEIWAFNRLRIPAFDPPEQNVIHNSND